MTPAEKKTIALLARMEAEMAFIEARFERLPKLKTMSAEWDATIARFLQRRRGDRSKLPGAAVMEEVAVVFARWRRRRLVREGLTRDEAWERALCETSVEFHVAPSTLEDWYKGKSRRRRRKRERES